MNKICKHNLKLLQKNPNTSFRQYGYWGEKIDYKYKNNAIFFRNEFITKQGEFPTGEFTEWMVLGNESAINHLSDNKLEEIS